jgi:TIR domain
MRIFVSYDNRDEEFVERLGDELEAVGIEKFTNDLRRYLGVKLLNLLELNRAMPGCSQVIVVLSPAYVGSDWLITELGAFRMKEENTKTDVIVPVKIENCKIPDQLKNHKCIDFSIRSFDEAFRELDSRILRDRHVFVVMDYRDRMHPTYEVVIDTIRSAGLNPVGKEHLLRGGNIDDRILTEIARSEIVFADLTGKRPNCCYETGYAHALGKEVILTIKKGNKIPFDLAMYPVIIWQDHEDLQAKLRKRLNYLTKGSS